MAAKKKAEAIQEELKEVNQELEALDEELLTDEEIEEISEEEEKPKKARKTKKTAVKAVDDEEVEKRSMFERAKDKAAEFKGNHPTGCKVIKGAVNAVIGVGLTTLGYILGKEDAFAAKEFLEDDEITTEE